MEPSLGPDISPSHLPEREAPAEAAEITATPRSLDKVPAYLAERVTIGPPPDWIVERPFEEKAPTIAGANPVLLLDQQYHPARHERYEQTIRRLDTVQVVHEAAQWRRDFDPATQRLTIHSLAVYRGERRAENAKLERFRLLQREENLDRLIIDGLATVVVLLEDVRCGDVIHASFTVHTLPRIFPDRFWFFASIPSRIPVHRYFLSLRFSTGHAMRWKSNDPKLTPVIREEGAETEWTWQTSDLKAAEYEPNVPPWHFVERWIQVTDFASWAEISAGFCAAWQEDFEDREVVNLVQSFAAEAASPAQRAERALNFVQDDIRYLSINVGLGGQIPSSPGSVISRGFGDCKDKTFLMTHLLRRLGISARPVLVNAHFRGAIQEFLPTPDAFDHVIVEYEIDGQRRCVDVTVPMQGGTVLSRPAPAFQIGLPIAPSVEDLETAAADSSQDHTELRETFRIDTSATSSLKVLLTATGRDADHWRRRLALEGPEALGRHREYFYQQLYSRARRVGTIEWRDDREKNEFMLGEAFDLEDSVEPTGDGRTCVFRFRAHVIQGALGFQEASTRQNPWALAFPSRTKQIIEIESSGMALDLRGAPQITCPSFRFECSSRQRRGFLAVTYTLRTMADAVPVAEFEAYKRKVREVWPVTALLIQFPRGSSMPWKKREPENPLQTMRRPGGAALKEARPGIASLAPASADPLVDASLPEIAPLLPSNVAPRNSVLESHKTRTDRPSETSADGERRQIQRPNPPTPQPRPETGSPSPGRQSRRNSRRNRQRLFVGLAIFAGAAILLALMVILLR